MPLAFSPHVTKAPPVGRVSILYRISPDGTAAIGSDPLSRQAALIMQNAAGQWEIALPEPVDCFGGGIPLPSLDVAKQMVEVAFAAYHRYRQG